MPLIAFVIMVIRDLVRRGRRKLLVWVDRAPLAEFAVIFAVGVLAFGFVYYFLGFWSQGPVPSRRGHTQPTLWDCLYFSIVTVSTLGYGDLVPRGLSKAAVCFEVFFGLATMGIMLAKLTSGRTSYHVRTLFRGEKQRLFEAFSTAFDTVHKDFTALTPRIGTAFQETPQGADQRSLQTISATEFARIIDVFHDRSLAFRREISAEVEQGDFFSEAPTEAIKRTAGSIERSLFQLGQLILSFPIAARSTLLNDENRRKISELVDAYSALNETAIAHCKDDELSQKFSQIAERCSTIPKNYFSVPEAKGAQSQPDQVPPQTTTCEIRAGE